MTTHIYIDLESIPGQHDWIKQDIAANVKHPGNMSKSETIAAWELNEKPKVIEEQYRKTSFDGACNHIICIGVAIGDQNPIVFNAENCAEEKTLLEDFYEFLDSRILNKFQRVFVGHNVHSFDLKILKQRSIILGVRPPDFIPFDNKPWDKNPFDTMQQWDAKNYVSLDKLCKAFGMEGKADDMDGSKVYDLWLAGEHEKIAQYCMDDVHKVREIHKRMTFMESVL
jgi:hypothetical protein